MHRRLILFAALLASADARLTRAEGAAELSDAAQRWTALMSEFRIPGMAVAVVRDQDVVYSVGLGTRDPDHVAAVTPDTVFYIGSSTQTFVAAAAAMLAEEGKLDLDAPVQRYLPKFRSGDPSVAAGVTVRDLLAQRKGIHSDGLGFRLRTTGQTDDEAFYRLIEKAQVRGTFEDSVVHYALLERIIEAVTERSWRELVQTRILTPARMTHTVTSAKELYGGPDAAVPIEDLSEVWYRSRFRKTEATMSAAGGMGSSVSDLARWLTLNLQNGSLDGKRILPSEALASLYVPQARIRSKGFLLWHDAYGMGWYVGTYGGKKLVYELGGMAGAQTHLSFMPEEKIGVVVLMNIGPPVGLFALAVACDVYERVLHLGGDDPFTSARESLKPGARPANRTAAISSGAAPGENGGLSLPARAYVGRYVHEDWGTLEVTAKDRELTLAIGEFKLNARTAGTDHFEFDMLVNARHGQFLFGANRTVTGVELQIDREHHTFLRK